MLRGFSASYAGHIVDDRLGFQGPPANDRWYPNAKLAEALDWAVDFAQVLDTLGYDELWMGEHFSATSEPIPSPLMLMASLVPQTKRITFSVRVATPRGWTPWSQPCWRRYSSARTTVEPEKRAQ